MVDANNTVFHCSLIVVSAFTFFINAATIAMFLRFRKQLLTKNVHYRVLCSLCFADALVGVFGVSLGINLATKSPKVSYKLAGNVPLFCCMFASIGSLSLLTANRLFALKLPHSYGTASYLRRSAHFIAAIWVFSFLVYWQQVAIFMLVGSAMELRTRSIATIVLFFTAAVCLIIANTSLYLGIKNRVTDRPKKSTSSNSFYTNETRKDISEEYSIGEPACASSSQPGVEGRREERSKHRANVRRKAIRISTICLMIVGLFLLLWTPLIVYRFMFAVGASLESKLLRRLFLCLTISNSLLNPVLYIFKDNSLRRYFIKMMPATCQ